MRAVSTSYLLNKAALSLAQVLKAAGCTNGYTFANFYNKLPQNDNYVILESYSQNETQPGAIVILDVYMIRIPIFVYIKS